MVSFKGNTNIKAEWNVFVVHQFNFTDQLPISYFRTMVINKPIIYSFALPKSRLSQLESSAQSQC